MEPRSYAKELPPIQSGFPGSPTQDKQPGKWANLIQKVPWAVGKEQPQPQRDILEYLDTLRPVREPALNCLEDINHTTFDHLVSLRRKNVEAVCAHIRGDRPLVACTRCQNEKGIFDTCIVIQTLDEPRLFPACTNCHWDSKKALCSLNKHLTEREQMDSNRRADFSDLRRRDRDLARQMKEMITEQKRQLFMAQQMIENLSQSVRRTERLVSDWKKDKAYFEIGSYIDEDQESSTDEESG